MYPGKFHAGRPSPSAMFEPTAKVLAATEASLSTNKRCQQPGQIFTREALDKVDFPLDISKCVAKESYSRPERLAGRRLGTIYAFGNSSRGPRIAALLSSA